MKKAFLILAGFAGILLAIGAGSAAIAAPVLTFDIDFYDGDTSYVQGAFDTGSTINLNIGEEVNADLYFSVTEEDIVGGGFALPFDASQLQASGLVIPYPPFTDTGLSGIGAGVVNYEAFVWPPGNSVGGDDILLATFTFTCIGPGLDDLYLNDLDDRVQWITTSGVILDDQLGKYLASISNVPIPGALWLLGSGVVGLVGIRRRMKKR